jgi:hypothetical protein
MLALSRVGVPKRDSISSKADSVSSDSTGLSGTAGLFNPWQPERSKTVIKIICHAIFLNGMADREERMEIFRIAGINLLNTAH